MNINIDVNISNIILYVCVFIYNVIIYTEHTHIMQTKTFILDEINRD